MNRRKSHVLLILSIVFTLTCGNSSFAAKANEPNKSDILIYEVFGGGGNQYSVYANDYIIIQNVSNKVCSLDDVILSKGTTSNIADKQYKLAGTIRPNGYYVIVGQGDYNNNKKFLEVPFARRAHDTLNIHSENFSIMLTRRGSSEIIDLVGAGNAQNFLVKRASPPGNSYSIRRVSNTGNNSVDFIRVNHSSVESERALNYLNEDNTREADENDYKLDELANNEPILDPSITFNLLKNRVGDKSIYLTDLSKGDQIMVEINGTIVVKETASDSNAEIKLDNPLAKGDRLSVYVVRYNRKSNSINRKIR